MVLVNVRGFWDFILRAEKFTSLWGAEVDFLSQLHGIN